MSHFEYFSDSSIIDTEPLNIQGVWVHDPSRPAESAVQYLYGKNGRSRSMETSATSRMLAGREFPVYDFGEHTTSNMSVSMIAASGPDHDEKVRKLYEFTRLRRPVTVRDNRGRMMTGTLLQTNEGENDLGTELAFEVNRVNIDPGEELH